MFFLFFLILFLIAGVANFGYMEQLGTMVWHWPWVRDMLLHPGGVADVLGLSLVQFFVYPWLGAVISAAVLGVASLALFRAVRRNEPALSLPLFFAAALPSVAQVALLYNTNYLYSGVVAYMLMCVALWLTPRRWWWASVVIAAAVYLLAGPVAWVYAIVCGMAIVVDGRKRPLVAVAKAIAPVAVVALLAWLTYRGGVAWRHAAGVDAYFTARLQAPFALAMPWLLTIVVALASLVGASLARKPKAAYTAAWALGIIVVAYAAVSVMGINRENQRFKALNLMVADRDWDGIIGEFAGNPTNNLLYQNILNLAYAERGMLGDSLMTQPVVDIRSIYQQGEKDPYVAMLMSDVFWSMGQVGQAQRYAFEANEMLGNRSPRMLRRLVETNRAFGADAVADKYKRILDKTLFHKGAPQTGGPRITTASGERVGFPSLDTELKHVIRANPDLQAPRQYLPSLYLLSKDLGRFREAIDSVYPARPLPRAFQEAMLLTDPEHPDSVAAAYAIDGDVVRRFAEFKGSQSPQPGTYWYFYWYAR